MGCRRGWLRSLVILAIILLFVSPVPGLTVESARQASEKQDECINGTTVSGLPPEPVHVDYPAVNWSRDKQLSDISRYNVNDTTPWFFPYERDIIAYKNYVHVFYEEVKTVPKFGGYGEVNSNITYRKSENYGKTWSSPVYLTNLKNGSFDNYPYLNTTSCLSTTSWKENLYIAWWEQVWEKDRDECIQHLMVRISNDNGTTWNPPITVDENIYQPYVPSIAVVDGIIHIAYEFPLGTLSYTRSSDDGSTWTIPHMLYDVSCRGPKLVANGATLHFFFAKWTGSPFGAKFEVWYMNSTDSGDSWNSPRPLTPVDGEESYWEDVEIEGRDIHLTFEDYRDHLYISGDDGINHAIPQIYYMHSIDAGATWSQDVRLSHSDNSSDDSEIAVVADEVQIIWNQAVAHEEEVPSTIYLACSHDGGATWGEGKPIVFSNGSSFWGEIYADENYMHVVFLSTRGGPYFREVFYKRYPDFAPERTIPLNPGWNLVSIPTDENVWTVNELFYSMWDDFDCIQMYESASASWKMYNKDWPHWMNQFTNIEDGEAFWIHVTDANGTEIRLWDENFTMPISTQLHKGWNLVGYPSTSTTTSIRCTLAGIPWDLVQKCDQTYPYNLRTLPGTYLMQPGEGYWVHVTEDCVWTV